MTITPDTNPLDYEKVITLGNSEVKIIPFGVGTWQWGDRMMWNFSKSYTTDDVQQAFQVSWEAGIRFFDTAEIYGNGLSERLLGRFVKDVSDQATIATKFLPLPWRLGRRGLQNALKDSLERLGLDHVALYQVHWPLPLMSIESLMDKMAALFESGLIKSIGVSNFNPVQTKRAFLALKQHNIPLASNQVEYSLLDRRIERSGLQELCQDLGVSIIAYSPLAKGALTGKYDAEHLPPGMRARTYNQALFTRIQPLIDLMREISRAHAGKTLPQIALNWALCKHTIVIPGAKNARQARENIGALGWRLSAEEVEALDQRSHGLA
jgi:aryl-alcohol dehydrogenase-like predicted oxidoreductase